MKMPLVGLGAGGAVDIQREGTGNAKVQSR